MQKQKTPGFIPWRSFSLYSAAIRLDASGGIRKLFHGFEYIFFSSSPRGTRWSALLPIADSGRLLTYPDLQVHSLLHGSAPLSDMSLLALPTPRSVGYTVLFVHHPQVWDHHGKRFLKAVVADRRMTCQRLFPSVRRRYTFSMPVPRCWRITSDFSLPRCVFQFSWPRIQW